MKTLLFVCDSFGEYSSPNGICVQKLAREGVQNGEKVFVLAKKTKSNEKDYEIIDGIIIYRIKASWLEYQINNMKKNSFGYKLLLFLSHINGAFHLWSYPKLYSSEVKKYFKAIQKLAKSNKIDYLIAVYKQIHGVLASIRFKRKNPGMCFVTYTLDSISGGFIPSICKNTRIPRASILKWERIIFNNSDYIFIMESHKKHYDSDKYKQYKQKIVVLDIPLLENREFDFKSKSNSISLVFTGSMSKTTANPTAFLYFLRNLKIDYTFNIYGRINDSLYSEINNLGLINNNIFFNGPISHENVMAKQNEANVLINFGNPNPNMIPCKIFEYMSTGNKILSISPSNSDPSIKYLSHYKNSLIVYEDELNDSNISDKILSFFTDDVSREYVLNDPFFEKCTPHFFFKCLFCLK